MAYRDESKLMTQDAPADVSTELCFDQTKGPFDGESMASTVVGTLTSKHDTDWVSVELTAGNEYTFTLAGSDTLTDTKIRILDSKGDEIMSVDDIDMDGDGVAESLHPTVKFTPEAGTGTQTYYIEVSAYTGNPGTNSFMMPAAWTLTADQMALPDPTEGESIDGTARMDDPDTADVDETNLVDDKLRGTAQNDTINGLAGNDSLYGMAGDDELNGGDGDDLLSGGPGEDELNGDNGNDTIEYSYSAMGVTINLATGTASGGDADGDTLGDDIESVIGSMHDDTLTGTRQANKLWGLGGNDELDGGRRDDMLWGGAGDDDLDGGDGDDMLNGGYGADVLTGGPSDPVNITSASGGDTASYGGSMMGVMVRLHSGQSMGGDAEGDTWPGTVTETYTNADDEEVMVSLPDIENLTGSGGDDILAGDFRDNIIMGGGGDDKIYGGPDPDNLPMDRGLVSNNDRLHGDAGDDMVFGGQGNDILEGGAGDDMLNGGPGADTYKGGAGNDMIYADAADTDINGYGPADDTNTSDVDESMDDVMVRDTLSYAKVQNETETGITATLGATVGTIAISNIENIIGSDYDDDLTGDAQDNVIEGGAGRDDLDGGGNPTENPMGDTLSYASSDGRVTVTLNAGAPATVSRGHARGDTAENFENVMGSAFDDRLTGDTGNNRLWGLAGDDELVGGEGMDTVEGGAGEDEMDGGVPESNTNEAGDTLSYAGSDAGVRVNLANLSVSGGHATGDTIVAVEDVDHDGDNLTEDDATEDGVNEGVDSDEIDVSTFENVTGSMHDDTLMGDHRMNVLNGGAGDDVLRGGAEVNVATSATDVTVPGGDHLIGGPGADVLDGGSSLAAGGDTPTDPSDDVQHVDWAVYRPAQVDKDTNAGVTVNLATNRGEAGEAEGDTLVNIELVWGSMGDDIFKAGEGPDWVHGDLGTDTMSYELSDMGVTVNLATDQADPTAWDGNPSVDDLGAAIDYIVDGTAVDFDGVVTQDQREDNTNGAAGDRLGHIQNLTGSNKGDSLLGSGQDNVLKGGGGNDKITGAGGADTLMGGDGDDMLGAVDIDGDGTAEAEDGDDTIMGGDGDDTINGGGGDDTITGGAGGDQLDGGGDNDIFVFSPDDGEEDDIITGIATFANEAIDLSAYGLDQETLIGLIDVFGGNVRIDLSSVGGNKIILDGVGALSDIGTVDTTTGALTALTMFGDTNEDGVFDDAEGGFILIA